MGVPSSSVSHQACSFELDPGELSSNGILGNRGLIHVLPNISRGSPADRESDSALAELLSGSTLGPVIPWDAVCVRVTCLFFADYTLAANALYKQVR